MKLKLTIQKQAKETDIPARKDFSLWLTQALATKVDLADITINLVTEDEMKRLNATYRQKDKSTNVLSFSYEHDDHRVVGDLVFCPSVIANEALLQKKTPILHWAHLTVHAALHLVGFDHENERDAIRMQNLEIAIMQVLGFANPYHEE